MAIRPGPHGWASGFFRSSRQRHLLNQLVRLSELLALPSIPYQNSNLKRKLQDSGITAPVIFMKLPLATVVFGFPRLTLLNRLKDSNRNWNFCFSFKVEILVEAETHVEGARTPVSIASQHAVASERIDRERRLFMY